MPDEKTDTERVICPGPQGYSKADKYSTPGYDIVRPCSYNSTTFSVRGWAAVTIETYTEELNEIIKSYGNLSFNPGFILKDFT